MRDIYREVVLPDELIAEILSYLSVKTLMQLRTVSKAWKTLISNPTFVNLHLQKSTRNPHLTIDWTDHDDNFTFSSRVLSLFPVRSLLENPQIVDKAFSNCIELKRDRLYSYPPYKEYYIRIVGSCNGLVCFYCRQVTVNDDRCSEYWLKFRNLGMGTVSEKFGRFLDFETAYWRSFRFSFGYDNLTRNYKVVAFRVLGQEYDSSPSCTSEVKVFNLGNNNSWRKIQSFPLPPLSFPHDHSQPSSAVHLFGTINWLALTNTSRSSYDSTHTSNVLPHINAENLVILSLSLSTETYTQLSLPKGFNEVLHVRPTLWVLRNCLYFLHDIRGTEFVMWQMREFGVQESWTQLIKVSYETLRMKNLPMGDGMHDIQLFPLYLSENSEKLIFASEENNDEDNQALIYNSKDDSLERTRFSKEIDWFSTIDYVESLVPTP